MENKNRRKNRPKVPLRTNKAFLPPFTGTAASVDAATTGGGAWIVGGTVGTTGAVANPLPLSPPSMASRLSKSSTVPVLLEGGEANAGGASTSSLFVSGDGFDIIMVAM